MSKKHKQLLSYCPNSTGERKAQSAKLQENVIMKTVILVKRRMREGRLSLFIAKHTTELLYLKQCAISFRENQTRAD
jgi:hypothetical protein